LKVPKKAFRYEGKCKKTNSPTAKTWGVEEKHLKLGERIHPPPPPRRGHKVPQNATSSKEQSLRKKRRVKKDKTAPPKMKKVENRSLHMFEKNEKKKPGDKNNTL